MTQKKIPMVWDDRARRLGPDSHPHPSAGGSISLADLQSSPEYEDIIRLSTVRIFNVFATLIINKFRD